MSDIDGFDPGPAADIVVRKDGERWTIVLTRELRHPPERVWEALTDPEHLRAWAPFDAEGSLAAAGTTVRLTTVGAPMPHVTEARILRADAPHTLEYEWGGDVLRWEVAPSSQGSRLVLWARIDRRYVAMGAAGWHLCLAVLERLLSGAPVGRIVGKDAFENPGWRRLHVEYARRFEIDSTAGSGGVDHP